MTTTTNTQADKITTSYTAFRSYSEMVLAMENGYVPTVSARRQRPLLNLLRDRLLPLFEVK